MRTRFLGVISFVLPALFGPAVLGQEKPEKSGPEDRLLEAELLEISTGDLERAKAIYQSLQADEKAPDAIRARALLYLARCHRKLGEIEAARKLLEELVSDKARDREIVRQANGLLRELQGGKAENPDFDWLKELEKNPEIQARVFDLAMDLLDPNRERATRARKQLLALGTVAVPVLERVIETTRDDQHRQLLAISLLYSGRFERLPLVLDASSLRNTARDVLKDFWSSVPWLPEETRARLVAALAKVPRTDKNEAYRDAFFLAAGDTSDFREKLERSEKQIGGVAFWSRGLLERILEKEPQTAAVMADHVLDEQCPFRREYFDILLQDAPAALGEAHWTAALRAWAAGPKYLARLEELKSFDLLARLAPAFAEPIIQFMSNNRTSEQLLQMDPRWAAVLRATKKPEGYLLLNAFAEHNEGAVPELVAFLKARAQETPEYLGHTNEWRENPVWKPSPRYAEAMAGLLDEKDPVVQAIALEALALAPAGTAPAVDAAIEKLARDAEDLHVREFALYAHLRRAEDRPEALARGAQLLLEEHDRRWKVREAVPPAYAASPLASVRWLGHIWLEPVRPRGQPVQPAVVRTKGSRGPSAARASAPSEPPGGFPGTLGWVVDRTDRKALYPHLLSLADSESGARLHEWFFDRAVLNGDSPGPAELLLQRLPSLKSRELRESIAGSLLWNHFTGALNPGKPFLRSIVLDRTLSLEARRKAFFWEVPGNEELIDWPAFLASDDPLAQELFSPKVPGPGQPTDTPTMRWADFRRSFWKWAESRPEAEQDTLYKAALASPHEAVRRHAVHSYPSQRPDAVRVFTKALEDPSKDVRLEAMDRIAGSSRVDTAPLLVRLLGEPLLRMKAIDALKRFALPESIEPLAKLLDDPDNEIRVKALEALREIRRTLEEKKEWQKVVQGLERKPGP